MAYVPSSAVTDPNAPQQPIQGVGGAPNAPMNLPPAPMTASAPGGASGKVAEGGGQGVSAVPNAGVQPPVQNLQDYLAANAPQAVGMGQKIASNLTAKAGQVTGDIGADLAAIDQEVQASNVTPNPTLINAAAANPAGFVTNPQNLTDFLAQENAKYTGPTSIEKTPQWAALTNEVQNAVQSAPDVTKPGGFLQLAAGQETNPTAGMTNLDAALLEETLGAAAPIIAAAQPYTALPGQLSAASTAEDAAIARAQANDAAAAGLIAPAFTTGPNAAVPAWENALTSRFGTAQGAVDTANRNIAKNVTTLNPMEQALKDWETRSGLSITDPITGMLTQKSFGQPTIGEVATPQDYATEAALQQLLGGRFTGAPLNPADVAKAGTFTAPNVQAADAGALAKQIADSATESEWAKIANTQFPGQPAGVTYQQVLDQHSIPGMNKVANESFTLAGNVPGWSATDPYESLLTYLQTVNPAGFGKSLPPGSVRVLS